MKTITAEEFLQIFGYEPKDDDLERVNCDKAGTIGHMQCGWCQTHDAPRLKCGCLFFRPGVK